jgi:hypothetical protein
VAVGVGFLDANGRLPLAREGFAEQKTLSPVISGNAKPSPRGRLNFPMPDAWSMAWQQPSFFLTQRQDHFTILA